MLDFRSLITPGGEPLGNLLSLRAEAGDTVLAIDRDGSGSAAGFVDVLRLAEVTISLSLEELVDQGAILL